MSKTYYVYIMASERNGTLYIGVTSNLIQRAWQHREAIIEGFTKKYGVKLLVYFESWADMAIAEISSYQTNAIWTRSMTLSPKTAAFRLVASRTNPTDS